MTGIISCSLGPSSYALYRSQFFQCKNTFFFCEILAWDCRRLEPGCSVWCIVRLIYFPFSLNSYSIGENFSQNFSRRAMAWNIHSTWLWSGCVCKGELLTRLGFPEDSLYLKSTWGSCSYNKRTSACGLMYVSMWHSLEFVLLFFILLLWMCVIQHFPHQACHIA